MTYQDDPNLKRRSHPMTPAASYTGWIVGTLAVLVAVVVAIYAMSGPTEQASSSRPADNTTTGSAVKPPASAPVQPTNPAGNVPTAPAPAR